MKAKIVFDKEQIFDLIKKVLLEKNTISEAGILKMEAIIERDYDSAEFEGVEIEVLLG